MVQLGTPAQIVTAPATEYVKKFVANVNPLTILRGEALMRPLASLPRDPRDPRVILLDRAGRYRCVLSAEGRLSALLVQGREGRFIPYDEALDLDRIAEDEIITGSSTRRCAPRSP